MLAKDLKPGDEIGTWTVVSVFEVCGVVESRVQSLGWSDGSKTQQTESVMRQADPWDTLILVKLQRGIPDPATKQTWFLADEEVGL